MSGKGYKEYRLGDYSNWLEKYVVNRKNWDEIRSCLIDAKICESLGNNNIPQVPNEFYKKNLSPIQVRYNFNFRIICLRFSSTIDEFSFRSRLKQNRTTTIKPRIN